MVDPALIAACIRRDRRAEERLYRVLHPLMLSICSRYERNRQDAVARMNEAYLKVLLNLEKRGPEVPFEAWVRRIVINTMIDHFRKERVQRDTERLDALPVASEAGNTANEYLARMEAEAFAELLRQVPEMSRRVFNLFALDGYTHAEIGDMLGISTGTSKWHVAHARQLLREALRKSQQAPAPLKNVLP